MYRLTFNQASIGGRIIKATQGRLLGGSSAINGQSFVAAAKAGIDAWEKLGNPGWNWDNLMPYYKKSSTLNLPDHETREHLGLDWVDNATHGATGPIQVSFPAVIQDPLAKAWVDCFDAMEYTTSADPFTGKSSGAFSSLAAVDPETKTRSYSATGYGLSAKGRPRVHIITEAIVQRIALEDSADSATTSSGVEVIIEGDVHTVKANKEVILSAGALNTPKLLEISGVGNQEILRKFDIPVKVNSPNVGENLQDHLMSGISFEVTDGVITGDALLRQEPEAVQSAMKMYTEHKTGPMTIGGVQSMAFMPLLELTGSSNEGTRKNWLDRLLKDATVHQKIAREVIDRGDAPTCSMFMFLAQANLHAQSATSFVGDQLHPENYLSLGIIQSLPFSRGDVHISSANTNEQQIVDPQYFTHPADIEIMARNLMDVEKLHKSDSIARYLKPNGKRNHPDAFLTGLDSAKTYLHDTATTAYHFCGTAAMLPKDKGGVVDEKLRVYGTTNLRVCDASIFPLIPRANPMSTVYAVAERAADIIKADA